MSESIPESDQLKVRESVSKLLEHFDSVLILVTRHNGSGGPGGETHSYEYGGGNYYAQLGQVTEWISMQDQFQRCEATRRVNRDE